MAAGSRAQRGAVSWPVLVTLALFLATIALIVCQALHLTHGAWAYPLDDTYIHMAIAKSFVTRGVWGVTPDSYTSSSSSPLWSLLIAIGFKLFGVNVLVPFGLALLFAIAVIFMLDRWVSADGARPAWVLIVLLLSVFSAPLPALTFSGMEHVMHILFTLLVLRFGLRLAGPNPTRRDAVLLAVFGVLLTMSRYEGLFLLFALAAMLALRGRWRAAILSGASGVLPVVAYGAISRAHGWYWLPNSVLLKGHGLHGGIRAIVKGLLLNASLQIWANPHVLVVLLGGLVMLLIPRRSEAGRQNRDALTLFVVMLLLHMQFAAIGWFFRYEAYLVCIGVALIGSGLWIERERLRGWLFEAPKLPRWVAAAALLVLVLQPLVGRAKESFQHASLAAANINGQQIQMAKFLHRFYPGQAVMVNDVGAVAFFGDEHVLDIWGLASLEPARLSLAHQWSIPVAESLAAKSGARVGIIYEIWFKQFGGTPPNWTRMGSWKIPKNVTCAFDSVTIFALERSETQPLARHLREFEAELPAEVTRFGPYRDLP